MHSIDWKYNEQLIGSLKGQPVSTELPHARCAGQVEWQHIFRNFATPLLRNKSHAFRLKYAMLLRAHGPTESACVRYDCCIQRPLGRQMTRNYFAKINTVFTNTWRLLLLLSLARGQTAQRKVLCVTCRTVTRSAWECNTFDLEIVTSHAYYIVNDTLVALRCVPEKHSSFLVFSLGARPTHTSITSPALARVVFVWRQIEQ